MEKLEENDFSNVLLEEVVFAISALQFDNEVQSTVCKCFNIDEESFRKIKNKVQSNREPIQLELTVSNIKLNNLHPSRIIASEGHFQCSLKAGDEPSFTTQKVDTKKPPQWKTHFQHKIKNFRSEKLDIEVWHDFEKDPKENSFLLRSIDTLSKKVKAALSPVSSLPEKAENESVDESKTTKYSPVENGTVNSESKSSSRRASMYSPDNNWVANAFVTLKKHKANNFEALRRSFLDINSTIPTGTSVLQDEPSKQLDFKLGSPLHEKVGEPSENDVKEKSEVNVKRQLFNVTDNEQFNASPTSDLPGFFLVPLRDTSLKNVKKATFGNSSLRIPRKLSEKLDSLKKSPGFGPQFLQKRMSMSDIDMSAETWHEEESQKSISRSKMDILNTFSPFKNLSPLTENPVMSIFKTSSKDVIGSASVNIRNSFLKMNCGKWSIEENSNLVINSPKKKQGLIFSKPESVVISFDLHVEAPPSRVLPITFVSESLKLFCKYEMEAHTEDNKDHENGIFLPIGANSKIILKSLAFVHSISDAKLSLAFWNCLVSDPFGKEVHPKYLFYWLTKIEASVSCSSSLVYTKMERDDLADSINRFISLLCNKFSRLHASFAINHNLELLYSLRCVHLLTESNSIHTIMEEADIFISISWPKSIILQVITNHASNWIDALLKEVPPEAPFSKKCLEMCDEISLKASLASNIRKGEQAFLAINDFLVLGEKVYEPVFKSELDESYLNSIWKILGKTLIRYLEPILPVVEMFHLKASAFLEMQDIHVSIWILVLHLSKLLRFQSRRKSFKIIDYELPLVFHKTSTLLLQLWIDISFSRAENTMRLELEMDTLTLEKDLGDTISVSNDNAVVSSSAAEFIDILTVFQERISRLAFPGEPETSDSIIKHIHNRVTSLLKIYQSQICKLALERSADQDMLSTQLCLTLNNIKKSILEAEKLLSKLANENIDISKYAIEDTTNDAAVYLFSKAFPRISSRFRNAFSKCRKDQLDVLLHWIISVLEPAVGKISFYATTLQYFWCFLFSILITEETMFTKPEEFQNLGDFVDSLYCFFKTVLRMNLFDHSELEFQRLLQKIELKSCSTSELVRQYFAQRYEEQSESSHRHQTLIVNIHFLKGKGLVADIHMGPTISQCSNGKRRSSWSFSKFAETQNHEKEISLKDPESGGRRPDSIMQYAEAIAERKTVPLVKATSHKILQLVTFSKVTEFYVKVKLQPFEWFSGCNERKSRKDPRNPPVFDSQVIFKQVEADCEGVRKGGFIVFRVKTSNSNISQNIGEAVFPLKEAPFVSSGERWKVKHSYLVVSQPSKIHDYPALLELSTRKHDKVAMSFLTTLEDYFSLN